MCKNFSHFRLHSEYSIGSSVVEIKSIINELKKDKQRAICLTDTDNLFGMNNFFKECLKSKIKPIVGCDMSLKIKSKIYKILLIVKNKRGYNNLLRILSRASLYNNNLLEVEWFKGELKKGLILVLNFNSFYYKESFKIKKIKKYSLLLKKIFKKNMYLEIQKNKNKNYNKIKNISNFLNIPLLPTNPISFIKKHDFLLYKAKIYIHQKNNDNIKLCKNHYFFSKKKISKIFKDIKLSLKNTYKLSKKCNFFISSNKIKLPFLRIKKKINIHLFFIKKLLKKIKNKKNINYNLYKKRLMDELKVVIKMNLCDYFLIVYDFMKWSKKKKLQVGPGRGSSAGSLISFLLEITNLDPIKYGLLFERFLNTEKESIPDFDIDFCKSDKKRVLNYINKKYGIAFICNIITFNKMCLKASIKDIGKFLNFNYDFINEINKLVLLNNNLNILEIIKKNKRFYDMYKKNKKIKILVNLCNKLEGSIKNTGIHAGGVLITPNKIFLYLPIFLQKKKILSHFFKDDLEELGLLKFDFLRLSTLNIIKTCLKKIKKKINFRNININEEKCYYNLKIANTIGVFQLESEGIRSFLKRAKPDCFENIIAIISLYRPGPIKLIKDFCLKKGGILKASYIDIRLKNILEETYGIIVYQEQIIQIAKIIANYSLNEADVFRKIIAKKKKNEMLKQKKIFIEKSLKNNIEYKNAIKIFNLIKEFANYGFNKAHGAAYSLLTYRTLWLKTFYDKYFMASSMSYCFKNWKKLELLIKDCKKNNIYILPININLSLRNFNVVESKNKNIRFGFTGIQGLGLNAISCILKEREKGHFKSFFDFYKRIDKGMVNYKNMENLITSGSFDSTNYNRANLIKKLIFLSKINLKQNFCLIENIYFKRCYYWKFKIKMIEERNSIGFFILNNIYNIYKMKSKKYNKNNIIKGIIDFISSKNINNDFLIYIENENNNKIIIKINKDLLERNLKNIKKYNFIMFIKKYKNNSKFINVENILKLC